MANGTERINSALQDSAKLLPEGGQKIAQARAELDAVVKTSENAANRIMDAAEQIQQAMRDGAGAHAKETILNAVTEIFEACNFQDLTGQRIRKAQETLNYLETVLRSSGKEALPKETHTQESRKTSDKQRPMTDKDLLNGPAAYGKAPSQNDIDALFDSLPKDKHS